MSWFLLILGGASLFERGAWGIAGAIMLLYGLFLFAFTAFTLYTKRELIKKPGALLAVSLIMMVVLIFAHVTFGHNILAMILSVLGIPVIVGYLRVRTGAGVKKK